jgi:hypothetical protein
MTRRFVVSRDEFDVATGPRRFMPRAHGAMRPATPAPQFNGAIMAFPGVSHGMRRPRPGIIKLRSYLCPNDCRPLTQVRA